MSPEDSCEVTNFNPGRIKLRFSHNRHATAAAARLIFEVHKPKAFDFLRLIGLTKPVKSIPK